MLVAIAAAAGLAAALRPLGAALGDDLVVILTVAGCILLWSTARLPEVVTALIFFLCCMLFEIAPAPVVFAGFSSSALWLVLGGMLVSMATAKTGLGRLAAGLVLRRFGTRYSVVLLAAVAMGAVLVPLVPSSLGRVMLLVPVLTALAQGLGFGRDSPQFASLVGAGILATAMPGLAILTASLPNMIMAGAAESILGVEVRYGAYALLHLPTVGIVTVLAILVTARLTAPVVQTRTAPLPAVNRITFPQTRLLVIIVGIVLACVGEQIHGVPLAWLILGGGLLCLMPRVGVLDQTAIGDLRFDFLIFIASVIGLGAVVAETGVAGRLADALAKGVDLSDAPNWLRYGWLVTVSWSAGLLVNDLAAPAVLTPLAPQLAVQTGWSLESTVLSQVPARALIALPYQSPLLVIGFGLAGIPIRRAVRFLLTYCVLAWPVLVPLHYLWGHALDVFP